MHHNRPKTTRPANLASTASALVALVAVAALMASLPGVGTGVRAVAAEARVSPIETPTVRAVAEAVAAAARELVGTDRITATVPAECFVEALAAPSTVQLPPLDETKRIRSRPLDERLIDLPPPAC